MSLPRKNLLANFVGQGWAAVMALAFIPLYIHFMGIEAYGLVGVFAALQALTTLLDMGLSSTLNREMARLSVREDSVQRMRDLLRTLEAVFWPMAILIGGAMFFLAPWIATQWLRSDTLPAPTTQYAIMLMGAAMALQWPFALYSGGLLGLQRQVLLNGIIVVSATVRGAGAVLVLWFVSPSIVAFFVWQIVSSLLQTTFVAFFAWRVLPRTGLRSSFRGEIIHEIWRFAAGMSGITVLAVILTQLDKIILSRLLPLETFGYYTLAGVAAASLYRLVSPFFSALYPRFTELVTRGEEEELVRLYHGSCQLLSLAVLPVAVVLAFFSKEILLLWTQDPTVARETWLILSLLVIGTAFNGLMNLPYALQLAYGWTRLALYANLIAVALLGPLIYVLALRYGAAGAALVWVLLNSGYILISLQVMHMRLLPAEKWRWYIKDVGLPLFAATVTAGAGRLLLPARLGMPALIAWLVLISVVVFTATALFTPRTRDWAASRMHRIRLSCA